VIDYWFTIFEYDGKCYAAFVGDLLNIYEIVFSGENVKKANFVKINELLIPPNCRVTISSNDQSIVVKWRIPDTLKYFSDFQ